MILSKGVFPPNLPLPLVEIVQSFWSRTSQARPSVKAVVALCFEYELCYIRL